MSDIFQTCTAIEQASDLDYLYMHLSNGYQYMAMTDYPYPANFLEPMPAWPVQVSTLPFADIPLADEWLQAHPQFKPTPKPEPVFFDPYAGQTRIIEAIPIINEEAEEVQQAWYQKMIAYLKEFFFNMIEKF